MHTFGILLSAFQLQRILRTLDQESEDESAEAYESVCDFIFSCGQTTESKGSAFRNGTSSKTESEARVNSQGVWCRDGVAQVEPSEGIFKVKAGGFLSFFLSVFFFFLFSSK